MIPERPQPLDPAACEDFAELLRCHLLRGTRPTGTPDSLGKPWDESDFLAKIGMNAKALLNWKNRKYVPRIGHLTKIESVLFGTDVRYESWRTQFRQFWREAQSHRSLLLDEASATGDSETVVQPRPVQDETIAAAAPAPSCTRTPLVDINRLPSTPFRRLAGREDDLALLDTAFTEQSQTRILSVIAWGGSGKTALVNAWLHGIQRDAYRGAEIVLGWSFYDQGTEGRTASSELFFSWALASLGAGEGLISATARGEALARLLHERRILLVLDGVEALQFGPGPRPGVLKDLGLRALLRRVAADPPRQHGSLILLTSRLAVTDIAGWEALGGSAHLHPLNALSPTAGAELLRDNGVHGTGPQAAQQLQDAAREFGGHPLALSLLAAFLAQGFGGDVRSRDRVGALLPEDAAVADEQLHGHARRVMRSIQTEWLSGEPVFQAIMEMVGLFDRPAPPDCLAALMDDGGVPGLSDALAGLSRRAWSAAIDRLRRANLLLPAGEGPAGSLDAHPLVREWFGDGLRRRDEASWRRAQARLYEHLCKTQEGEQPSREDLEPLYRAIVHGCRADRHRSALMEVYADRICRQRPNADINNYAGQILGAVSENLAAISAFFVEPYARVHPSLDEAQRHWVLSEAAFGLRESGRLAEAAEPQHLAVKICVQQQDWVKACIAAYNLSEIHQQSGALPQALTAVVEARNYAERANDPYWLFIVTWYEAYLLILKGAYSEATSRLQAALEQTFPASRASHLTTIRRLVSCTISLRTRNWLEVRRKAAELGSFAAERGWRLPVALAKLYVCQSEFGRLVDDLAAAPAMRAGPKFGTRVQALTKAYDMVLDALVETDLGSERPRGYLARARFRMAVGDWNGAKLDLDEAQEIAGVGPMRLYLAEVALLRCHLSVACEQGFAPLAIEQFADHCSSATRPNDVESHLHEARSLICQCNYFDLRNEWQALFDIFEGKSLMSASSIFT